MQVVINYQRVDKPLARYVEGLIEDDGIRLATLTVFTNLDEFRPPWIGRGDRVASIAKYLFYQEHFAVMELRGPEGQLVGYYCDVVGKVEKLGGEYFVKDLVVDLWIAPDGSTRELDWDEFQSAVNRQMLTADEAACALATFDRMTQEARAGTFPAAYIGACLGR